MAYLGNPAAQGNFAVIDDISGSFNGSTTQFTIQVGSTTQIIGSLNQLLIHINGVYQVMDWNEDGTLIVEQDDRGYKHRMKVTIEEVIK